MSASISGMVDTLPERVNRNPVLQRLGRRCSSEVLLEIGDSAFHLVFERGRLAAVIRGPLAMRSWTFALRGEEDAWHRFWQPLPEPGYHDIFAMTRTGVLNIEGDVGSLLAHLRFFKEVLALPRAAISGS